MMNEEMQKRLEELTPKGKKFYDLEETEKKEIWIKLIEEFGEKNVERFFKSTGQEESLGKVAVEKEQIGKVTAEKKQIDIKDAKLRELIEYYKATESKDAQIYITLYKRCVKSSWINKEFFDLKPCFEEIFFGKSQSRLSKKKNDDSNTEGQKTSIASPSDSSKQKSSIEVESITNLPLALAIRELLSSFDAQNIGEDKIKGLIQFKTDFDKTVTPSLPPERKINDSGAQIISRFKSEVIASEDAIARLKELKIHRLTTPISELFDFALYLKDSSHKSIRDIEIRDDEDRLSYHYYTEHKNDEYIYLDDILCGNIGLVWQDDCGDDTKLKISDCLKLQRERDEGKLEAEFDIHKTKDARIYACYSISQNPYLSAELANEVVGITESAFEYFPYPKDFQAMIDAIHTNIYKKFPGVTVRNGQVNNDRTAFETAFKDFEKLDSAMWYKGIELTSNKYSSKKTVLAKKLGESNNDYRKYIQLKSEWVWSISIILDNFWIDDDCYGINFTKSQIAEYALFVLCEVQHDEIISHLKQKLIDDKKHEKLLLKDYDFDILAGILSISANIHLIIRRLLAVSTGKSEKEKLYKVYSDWRGTADDILGKNPEELIGKIEEHPDLYGDLWYSFQEIWTGMRFWLKDYNIDSTRVLKLANDGWQREKYYSKLQEKVDEDNMSMSLFTYLIVCYCFGCEDNKKKALEDMRSMSSEIVKAVAKNIKDELKSFGSASNKYKKALEDLKGSIDGK